MRSDSHIVDQLLNHRVGLHVLFWFMISVIFYAFFSTLIFSSLSVYLINLIAILPSQIFLTYILAYIVIPRFLLTKKYFLFIITFLATLYIALVMTRTLTIYVVEDITDRGFPKESLWLILSEIKHLIIRYLLTVLLAPMIFIPIKLLKERLEEKSKIESLEKEKANAQLKFLKLQIHPHFLFNTLNNLYLLTLERRKEAPEVVLKLSEMLDYMLYQCNDETVSLSKEIELIKNYIDLERLRYDDRLVLKFSTEIENQQARIAPLILLTFTENAFKHGAADDSGKINIDIKIKEDKGKLTMRVYNTKPASVRTSSHTGIGLENMESQLALQYPGTHEKNVTETQNSYEVILNIEL